MRLLDTITLELHEFNFNIPLYAILSHTWATEEVAFEEFGTSEAEQKLGYQKIKRCCMQAASDGFKFVWIDTCCIDKRSSTELSEAINSMYRWYENSQVCYAYLADVPGGQYHEHPESDFAKSKWFTRGWTLQELVAPSDVVLFDHDWNELGTKASLRDAISQITKIDKSVLKCGREALKASIAQRMSWASQRETTRVEDIAYSLLGIFNVNMPLLYGEGENAFQRLQLELLNIPNDHTIFAWTMAEDDHTNRGRLGLLAPSVAQFSECGSVIQSGDKDSSSHYMTNIGLSITLPTARVRGRPSNVYLAFLNCYREYPNISHEDSKRICLYLNHEGNSRFSRFSLGERSLRERYWTRMTPMIITRVRSVYESVIDSPEPALSLLKLPSPETGYRLQKIFSSGGDRATTGLKEGMTLTSFPPYVALRFENRGGETFAVILGREDGEVWLALLANISVSFLEEAVNFTSPDSHHSISASRSAEYIHITQNRHFTDRLSIGLPSGLSVFIALKKIQVRGLIEFNLEVSVRSLDLTPTSQIQDIPVTERTSLLSSSETLPLSRVGSINLEHWSRFSEYRKRWTLWPIVHKAGDILLNSYNKFLMGFIPLGITAGLLHWNATAVFVLNFLAIMSLSPLLQFTGDKLWSSLESLLSISTNVVFRNVVAIIVSIVALQKGEIAIVQWYMMGSILFNVLCVLGCCFTISGILRLEQSLNFAAASTMLSLMAVASASLILPATMYAVWATSLNDVYSATIDLSRGIATLLLLLYFVYSYFQLKSPSTFFDVEQYEGEELEHSREDHILGLVTAGAIWLFAVALVAVCTEYLVSSLDSVAKTVNISKIFIGFVVLPVLGSGAAPASATIAAYTNRLDSAVRIVIENVMQITLFIMPSMVILGWIIDQPMTLHFGTLEIIAFFLGLFVVTHLVQHGKSDSLGGTMCVATYFIIALTIYFYKDDTGGL